MKIPDSAIITDEKLTQYLLVYRARNDKSQFLARAGFTANNAKALKTAIQTIARTNEAVEERRNEYGVFYRVAGELVGTNAVVLPVVTIWLQQADGIFKFVTLKPLKERRS